MKQGLHFKKITKIVLVAVVSIFGAAMATHYYYVYRNHPRAWPFTPKLPPLKKFPLTASDLAFGQKQVDQMMRDRPAMAQLVEKGDVIYEWTVRQFAGESLGHRILWRPVISADIAPFILAYNWGPSNSSYGSIFVRNKYTDGPKKGESIDSEELWSMVVFEAFNISNWRAFSASESAAFFGKLSRDDYIKQMAQTEFSATKRTTQFYQEIWQPWVAKSGAATQPHLWFVDAPNSFEEWIKLYTDPSRYPYGYYGPDYDRLTKDKIVFVMSANHASAHIYIMTSDGRVGKRLTYMPCFNTYARLSPDKKKIVFSSNRSGKDSLYIMNANGSQVIKLPNDNAQYPNFSPDGKTIVYAAKQSGFYEIYSMNSDGTNQVQLTHIKTDHANVAPAVSPDGHKIVFTFIRRVKSAKQQKPQFFSDIYLMNRDGTNLTRLTNNLPKVSQPCFSPDGQKIAFASSRNGNNDLYIMNIDSTGVIQLTNNAAQDGQPCFSPDGKSLVFVSNRLDGKKYQLFKLDIATKKATLLFKTKYHAQYPDWK